MAFAVSNVVFQCPNSRLKSCNNTCFSTPKLSPSFLSFSRKSPLNKWVVCAASSAAGSSSSDNELNPYEVLGVSPIDGFEMVKAAYTRKRKDADRRGDEMTAARLEKAYDKVMMEQLTKRKKGMTFGSMKVSKDIKYADKQPIVPWGPRFSKCDAEDMKINLGISAVATAWIIMNRSADWMPLQCLAFVFVYRMFEKLKASEPSVSPTFTEEGEDEGRMMRMGKRLLRSLALVFGCIAIVSMGYTFLVNLIEKCLGFVPAVLFNQELVVTAASATALYTLASYYR